MLKYIVLSMCVAAMFEVATYEEPDWWADRKALIERGKRLCEKGYGVYEYGKAGIVECYDKTKFNTFTMKEVYSGS